MQCGFWTARKSNTKFFNMNAMNLSTGFTQQRKPTCLYDAVIQASIKNPQQQYYVLVLPIAEEVDLKKAAKAVGEKSIEMIHVKDITAVSGYVRGGCSPIGMKKQYPTVIQECAANFDKVYVSGGRIGTTLCMAPEDLKKVSRAEYADFIQ
mgnify:CR=1 FL=1